MLKHSTCQSDDQSSSIAKPSQQLWTAAACPAVDHDACPEGEVSSSSRPPLSRRYVVIMAAAGGIAVANLYYNQPMLPDIGRSFGVAADVIAVLPMSTQIGYALGLFLFVPLGDIVDRRQLRLSSARHDSGAALLAPCRRVSWPASCSPGRCPVRSAHIFLAGVRCFG
jgi:hypothetical protein